MAEGKSANLQGDNNLAAGEKMGENENGVGERQLTTEELKKKRKNELNLKYYYQNREERILKNREYYANKTAGKPRQKPGPKRLDIPLNNPN